MGVKFKKKEIILNGTKYQAESIIGQGQYGVIYLGKSPGKKNNGDKIPKEVAIKEYFYSRFRDQDGNNFCDAYWKKEVATTETQGKYPAAQMKLIDSGIVDTNNAKSYFLVLTFIPGKSIKDWYDITYKNRPQLNENDIALLTEQILIPIARHLEFCHGKGLIHRDLSIDNVLIMNPKKDIFIPTIIDWGASKLRDPRHVFNPPNPYMGSSTMTGTAFMNKGTPPEIIGGMEPIAASDIYMFGHLCYYLLTGGKTCRTPALKEDYVLHPKKENPAVAPEYDQLVARCTQYEPADRIKTMSDVIHALQRLVEKVTPSQITGFLKPKTFTPAKPTPAQYVRAAQITNQMASSPNVQPSINSGFGTGARVSPYNYPFPMQGVIANPTGASQSPQLQQAAQGTPSTANPVYIPKAVPIPREVQTKQNTPIQANNQDNRVSNPINLPASPLSPVRSSQPAPNVQNRPPPMPVQPNPSIPNYYSNQQSNNYPNQQPNSNPIGGYVSASISNPTYASPQATAPSPQPPASFQMPQYQQINSTPVVQPQVPNSSQPANISPISNIPPIPEREIPPRMQNFIPAMTTVQYAQAFITYYADPKWEYLRQDTVQTYYTFFEGVLNALKQKKPLIHCEKVQGNVYFVGRTIGSLNEVRQIGIYIQKVFQKAPQTRVVFLGNYFNLNKADLESFTYILSLKSMFPNNIILLRGPTEEQSIMEEGGFQAHLNLKFGAYAEHIFRIIVELVSHLDLLYISEFNPNLRVLATSGGIPFSSKRQMDALPLGSLEELLLVRGVTSRDLIDEISQSILWGVPNELADSSGADSDGNIYFSWSLFQKFIQKNKLQYLVRSDTGDKGGHRVIWNIISGLNSSSLERNKLVKEAKILRISPNGISDLIIKDLQFYYDRDYGRI